MVRMVGLRAALCAAMAALALSHGEADAGFIKLPSGSNAASSSSFAGGGHAGYNWQRGPFVFGFETDLQATRLNSMMNDNVALQRAGVPGSPLLAQTSALIDWYGTVRGRLGVASGPWLIYGTAGLAYGQVDLTSSFTYGNVSTSLQQSQVRTGWVAGAGVNYLVAPNVSVNLIYQYVDLGNVSAASTNTTLAFIPFGDVTLNQSASVHAQFQTVMVGLSWRFAAMPQSGPWAGAYVGGNVGGAWGNDANAAYSSSSVCCTAGSALSDARLKRDIELVGRRSDGLGLYSFKYVWSDATYIGVMAQEVALIHPEAVLHDPLTGYLAVDYGRLGLPLVMVH